MSIRRKIVIEGSEEDFESCAGICHIKAGELEETGGNAKLADFLEGSAMTMYALENHEYIKDADTFLTIITAIFNRLQNKEEK